MLIFDIPDMLRKIIFNFTQSPHAIQNKYIYLHNDSGLFSIKFTVGEKVMFNAGTLQGSHDKLLEYKITEFIQQSSVSSRLTSKMYFDVNFNDDLTRRIYITFTQIHENDFLILEDDIKNTILDKKEKKYKNKLYQIIIENSDGIELSEIIQKTRAIKNPEERKNLLAKLVSEDKIKMVIDSSSGRRKRIYKAI